ncbi:MAG: hypothetical protein US25_C0003G0003 [Candidatus Moranbacteria bacterium GW2011_GWE1_36_7]|nr:MAG: hypothetical protein UR99_C0014G0003 [Candidatus Moranbacteria bacterium GW2011_GWD2_36_12]KKQ06435.1 MAG: hypothetical protein US16_C0017G0003 [Candidatus Moranbacteria bacterium GW2011_GWE2_36_40]KKQ15485.1 MAG: hypothetical protein US25_C0003G0003 [Candidatus Moranbacteria bacterium GW2011_GWE1_36_7]
MDIISSSIIGIGADIKTAAEVMNYVWFIALPPILFFLFKELWIYHIQSAYWAAPDWVVLEIIPPKNIEKSPKPMEALFTTFAGVEKSFDIAEEYISGMFPDYMSLEIVSNEGSVHFYIRSMKKYRHLVEAALYAQYPDVEILEVPDYVNEVPRVIPNGQWDLWGADIAFTNKHDGYPIRTYAQFEEDITGTMIDPLAGLLEVMGKLGPGQQMWLQWVIYPKSPSWGLKAGKALADKLKGKEKIEKSLLESVWTDFQHVVTHLFAGLKGPVEFPAEKKKEDQPLDTRLSPGERDVLKAVEENLGKWQFGVKGRYVYLGRRENFDKALGVSGFWGSLKQFNDDNMNGFKPDNTSKTFANWINQRNRLRYRQRKILRRYRTRNKDGVMITLSTAELATIFHLPDMNVMAPSLTRVEAKRGGAPSNLPIE